MVIKNRGDKVLIEVQFRKRVPFTGLVHYDPTTAKITVIDKDETVKVNAQDLEKSDTGKYYYEVQTLSSWITGRYSATVVSTGTPPDTTTNPRCFFLL